MKKVIFTVFLLAVASLGLALPPPQTSALTTVLTDASSPQAVQTGLQVSKDCAAALVTIMTSPEFLKCIPIPAITPILPIVTDPNFLKNLKADPAGTFKKVEPAFVKFSTDFCPAPKCSDDGVVGAVKIITDGCAKDLQTNPIIQLIFTVTVFYSPIHDTICFKSSSTKLFCWDETLQTVFGLPKSPIKVTGDPLLDSVAVADCKAVCTDCNKDVVNTFLNFIGDPKNPLHDTALNILKGAGIDDKQLDGLKLGIAVKCGISFEDGKIPDKP